MVAHDPCIDRAVLMYNQISGPIFFFSALAVVLLMLFDNDKRNRVYRRMILCLQHTLLDLMNGASTAYRKISGGSRHIRIQLFSIAADQMLCISAMVALAGNWVIYQAGFSFGLSIINLMVRQTADVTPTPTRE
ncbi:hypothetical protein PRIPAC_77935 [Pristionchus pacificus]|uniref:Uncharacterized protein n=1 Tax=Pristionchus pacificus TaxID=54126 RepID=A0A2A6CM11_PRIPA|nr:hypothetical protein PRIPAC_77935 [Pristionchus pacificus]|eukprot:PDM79244.1 hypothetical protein PRIPAC_31823 [Pristionchus pacificus]